MYQATHVLRQLHVCTFLTHTCTIPNTHVRLATRNRTGWLHMCVNLQAHAHVYNIVSGWYSMYDHVSDLGSITLVFVFNCN